MTGTQTTKAFQTRLEDLMSETKKTLRDIENDTGISRAALNNYANDKAEIGINNLVKLARYFNVSADYLIGLSEAKTNDKELKDICDYVGLSDEAIEQLRQHCTQAFYDSAFIPPKGLSREDYLPVIESNKCAINKFISSDAFLNVIRRFKDIQHINDAIKLTFAIYFGDYEYFSKLYHFEGNDCIEDFQDFYEDFEAYISIEPNDKIDLYVFQLQKQMQYYVDELSYLKYFKDVKNQRYLGFLMAVVLDAIHSFVEKSEDIEQLPKKIKDKINEIISIDVFEKETECFKSLYEQLKRDH